MKVIKHCATRYPSTATGSLVGMDVNGTLEVTNTFPFPIVDLPQDAQSQYEQQHFNSAAAAPRAKANTAYQAEMIRMLREVNVDANNVGWYISANLGNFVNTNFIENQYFYQKDLNERTIALVHDVSRSSQGALSLRAFRLSPQFVAAYKENKFTTDKYVLVSLVEILTNNLQPTKIRSQILGYSSRTTYPDPQLTSCYHLSTSNPVPALKRYATRAYICGLDREQPSTDPRYSCPNFR